MRHSEPQYQDLDPQPDLGGCGSKSSWKCRDPDKYIKYESAILLYTETNTGNIVQISCCTVRTVSTCTLQQEDLS